MSKDIKLGSNILTGVTTLKVEDANTSGTYDSFIDTTDATAVASEILSGKTAYVNGVKVTGTAPSTESIYSGILANSYGSITFYITDTNSVTHTFTCDDGDTWADISETDITISGTDVLYDGVAIQYNSANVLSTDVIVANRTYIVYEAPSGYSITISGTYDYDFGNNVDTSITIDGVTCSVDPSGTQTNIPHTFTNVSSFMISAGSASAFSWKVTSGTGTYINEPTDEYGTIELNTEYFNFTDVNFTTITPTSDMQILLGFHED